LLGTRTIYKILKRHGLNLLNKYRYMRRGYKQFAMKHFNDLVQMDIPGPFYRSSSSERDHIINCLDDCSRKVANKWSERKSSVNVLNVIEDWIKVKGKPDKGKK
jgi:hypothetical protein